MGETTIFEAQTLIAAMKARAKQYEALRGQFQDLRTAFQNITTLDDFKGKRGAGDQRILSGAD
ncbi:T7SS effector LXG polymorphic toxin [Terrilactibacillus sp. S3-3]|nr:T7SS effector LXG polymorphic toxin [Terrilactibacillus sp. S3-3]